eukprot:1315433-Amorphochlora_amoeboformis.AAC.1
MEERDGGTEGEKWKEGERERTLPDNGNVDTLRVVWGMESGKIRRFSKEGRDVKGTEQASRANGAGHCSTVTPKPRRIPTNPREFLETPGIPGDKRGLIRILDSVDSGSRYLHI